MAGGAAPVTAWLLPLAIALLPVLGFLGALVWLDSYKLVRPRLVAATIAAGAVAAGLGHWVDLPCHLRLHVEFALRAKFEELAYLEDSIGKTGRLAMKPFLQVSRKDLWQLYVLGR